MRTTAEILKSIETLRFRRPLPPGGWVSNLSTPQYRVFMKELQTWRDSLEGLELELAISRKAEVVVFITAPIPAHHKKGERERTEAPPPANLHILLSDMEAAEKRIVAAYTPGDRDAYIKIRNLQAGINMRRERFGLPCLSFAQLPRPTHKRRSAA